MSLSVPFHLFSQQCLSQRLTFVLFQLLMAGLLVLLNSRPEYSVPPGILICIIACAIVSDALYIHYFMAYFRELYSAEYVRKRKAYCQTLLESYNAFGIRQKKLQKDVHDVFNAQFTYHSLLEENRTEDAERFRAEKQNEWRTE